MMQDTMPALSRTRRMQWDAMAERVSTAIKDKWKPHKETLFGAKIERSPFFPWL